MQPEHTNISTLSESEWVGYGCSVHHVLWCIVHPQYRYQSTLHYMCTLSLCKDVLYALLATSTDSSTTLPLVLQWWCLVHLEPITSQASPTPRNSMDAIHECMASCSSPPTTRCTEVHKQCKYIYCIPTDVSVYTYYVCNTSCDTLPTDVHMLLLCTLAHTYVSAVHNI